MKSRRAPARLSLEPIFPAGLLLLESFLLALGFTSDKSPCASTLHNIFSQLDKELLEAKLAQWAQGLLQETSQDLLDDEIAIDGKTLRDSKKQGCWRHIYFRRFLINEDKTNEIGAIEELLKGLF